MTRASIYAGGLVLTIVCTAMTIASIALPQWVTYSPNGERQYSYGLHSRYSYASHTNVAFPQKKECRKDPEFCNMWRTVGFLMSFAVVIELCTLVSFIVIIGGGVQRRISGWQVASGVLFFAAVVQCAGMAIVAFLYDHDTRFWDDWHLDTSFHLVTASWSILILTSFAIIASALYLPPEGDYELIPDQNQAEPDDQLLSRIAAWDNGWKGSNSSEEYSYQRDQDGMSDLASIRSSRSEAVKSKSGAK